MDKETIKNAFLKVKEHITSIDGDLSLTKLDLLSLKQEVKIISSSLGELITTLDSYIQQTNQQTHQQTQAFFAHSELLEKFMQQTNEQLRSITTALQQAAQAHQQPPRHVENIFQGPSPVQAYQEIEHLQTLFQQFTQQANSQFTALHQKIDHLQSLIHNSNNRKNLQQVNPTDKPTNLSADPTIQQTNQQVNPTNRQINPTDISLLREIPTDNQPFYHLISTYKNISNGNEGVPTDKPTDRQTNQQTTDRRINTNFNTGPTLLKSLESSKKTESIIIQSKLNNLEKASEILLSLDSLKKEIRLKFKRLTQQEFLIFSTIYQLEEEGHLTDYRLVAEKLALSESSVREYVQKIIAKGIPIQKEKINNKKILLSISRDLKKISSLETIMQLREI